MTPGTVALGEVGLLGELRAVSGIERRVREAARLGFERAIVPRSRSGASPGDLDGVELVAVATLRDAISLALESGGKAQPSAAEQIVRVPIP